MESRIAKQKAEQVTPERLLWNYISSSEEQREQIRPMLEEKIGVTKDTQFTMLLIHPDSMANESYGEMKEELENQMEALCMENYYMLIRPGEQGGIYIVLVDTVRNRTLNGSLNCGSCQRSRTSLHVWQPWIALWVLCSYRM